MKTLFFFFCIVCTFGSAFSQERSLGGIVFDKDTKFRVNRVTITNLRTQKTVYNNTKGEFFINVKDGDLIVSAVSGYISDTTKIKDQTSVAIYLQRLAIPLREVTVKDSVLSAKAQYEETKKAFNQAVRLGDNSDIINVGPNGAGLGIDAIWNTFSREGRNARHLMDIMERDYQNAMVDQVFNKDLVKRTTGLKGDKLLFFMLNYRPPYIFAVKANDYEMTSYIKQAYRRFQMDEDLQDVSQLKPIDIN